MTFLAGGLDVGDTRKFTATFRDVNGALTDPTTINLKHRDPSGNAATVSMSQVSTGIYTYTLQFDEPGTWYVRIEGDPSADGAAVEGTIIVNSTVFS